MKLLEALSSALDCIVVSEETMQPRWKWVQTVHLFWKCMEKAQTIARGNAICDMADVSRVVERFQHGFNSGLAIMRPGLRTALTKASLSLSHEAGCLLTRVLLHLEYVRTLRRCVCTSRAVSQRLEMDLHVDFLPKDLACSAVGSSPGQKWFDAVAVVVNKLLAIQWAVQELYRSVCRCSKCLQARTAARGVTSVHLAKQLASLSALNVPTEHLRSERHDSAG